MRMKSIAVVIGILASAQLCAEERPLSVDQVVAESDGIGHIIRRTEWTDFNGGMVEVDQLLKSDGFGRHVYRYDEQTEATKLYHQAFCDAMGMSPSPGEGIVVGSAAGWACSSSDADALDEGQSQPKVADWATAIAPSGRVPVGATFTSNGQIRVESSVGGERRATVGVDNGRCSYASVTHYANAFRENTAISVACIVHASRFVNTSMDVCIPRVCGSDRGTHFAQ